MELGALSFDLFYGDVDEHLVRRAVTTVVDRNCHTERDGGTDQHHYIGAASDYDPVWLDGDDVVDTLASAGGVTLFWLEDFDFNLHVDPDGVGHGVPMASFWLDEVFYRPVRTSEAEVRGRVEALLEVVCAVAERTEPAAGYGYIDEIVGREGGAYEAVGTDALESGTADVVHWFTLLPADRVDALGRERVLEAPAWRVRELSTGTVALVASEQPVYGGGDRRQAIADHLGLDGPEQRQILDPEERGAPEPD
jgi:hypothetical protein